MMTPLQLLDHFRRLVRYGDSLQKAIITAYRSAILETLEAERKAVEIEAAKAEQELEKRRIPYR